jgi:hypothetical protein
LRNMGTDQDRFFQGNRDWMISAWIFPTVILIDLRCGQREHPLADATSDFPRASL